MCLGFPKVFWFCFGSFSHVFEILLFSKQNCVVLWNDHFLFLFLFIYLFFANVFWPLGAFVITEMSDAKSPDYTLSLLETKQQVMRVKYRLVSEWHPGNSTFTAAVSLFNPSQRKISVTTQDDHRRLSIQTAKTQMSQD